MKKIETILGNETAGMIYGFLGVLGFSVTLPATRIAVQTLDPMFVGFGRAIVAGILASALLIATKQRLPTFAQIKSLIIVSSGVIIGFPILSAWALQSVPASHGAIIIGIIPLATVVAGIFRANENPSLKFWVISFLGSLIIVLYAYFSGSGSIQLEDIALIGAVVAAAIGYAEGAKLAKTLGGWKVISWALVLSAPFLLIPVLFSINSNYTTVPLEAWVSFGYVSLISQFVAFFVWYKGMAIGGIAKVGQIQLLQPFLTIIFSAFILGESITPLAILAMGLIALLVAIGKSVVVQKQKSIQKH